MEKRNALIESFAGRKVHVIVDRPMGCNHKGIPYPINYGFLPGVMAGDGEEQDVYILGVTTAIQEFDGIIIGAAVRRDDVEDKLIAAPAGMTFSLEEMARAVHFQEQYFDTEILCL